VQLSTRGRYAVMARVELARRSCGDVTAPCGPVSLHEIATCQQLSLCYLEQLFGGLRRAGLVTSARGPSGGYRLARPPGQVSIGEIVGAVDETLRATRCTPGSTGCMQGPDGTMAMCQTHEVWAELGRQIGLFLDAITLADVLQGRVLGRAVQPQRVAAPDTHRAA
jgi:Rrf2 family iron-sulfur cluster assembly transcriptional regulator